MILKNWTFKAPPHFNRTHGIGSELAVRLTENRFLRGSRSVKDCARPAQRINLLTSKSVLVTFLDEVNFNSSD